MAKTTKKSTKATNAEIIQRLSEIRDLLLEGKTRFAILEYAGKWNLSDSQVDNYIASATAQIKEVAQQDASTDISLIVSNLWDLFNKNKSTNPQVARQCLMDIAKIRGMDQTTVNHTFKRDEDLAKLSDEDFDKKMEAALAERH